VGPNLGLDLVHTHEAVSEIANLGLVFLLFMIGLELDVHEILRMGRVVLLTGLFQFPVCFGAQYLLFTGLNAIGLSLGTGQYAGMYCALVCAISSTMIVVKLLSEKGETERPNGRLTVGILIFQDIWAMVFLAIQPNLANPDLLTLCKQFGMIAALIILALGYAKFVMPAVLFFASRSVELMLVLSLSWCFFMGVTAHLPWVGVGMELAALIAGVALATFPYSAEFNGKIKYIRDFFITLFFAALGMQIPVPSAKPIFTALLIAICVLLFRWLGIFCLVYILGGSARLGILATINLSQISEFALVICSLGMSYGHIDDTTLEIIIWVFMMLSILSSNLMTYNHQIFRRLAWLSRKVLKQRGIQDTDDGPMHEEDERDILLLGFHRIASMMVAEFEQHNPKLLRKLQVVEFNQAVKEPLLRRGIKFSYGDFSSADVLEHCFHGEPKIVISTTPDTMLQGTTNFAILKVAMSVWPKAHIIVTADNPQQAAELYEAGAHYVLRSAKLCAERLYELLNKFETDAGMSDLQRRFDKFKKKENDQLRKFIALKV
ncbi:Glutathione-regulated potassium-efflux system protein KefC (K(+)/H(+) antiporter), partial [Durusdinium trenchii]